MQILSYGHFLFCAVITVVSSNIASVMSSLTVPRSSVVLISDRVELKCIVTGSDSPLWKYTAWNTSTDTNIYAYRKIVISMRSRYKADNNISGHHNLIIDSVDLAHAGRYRCSAVIEETLSTDIQLAVLGSNPVCAANSTESHVDGSKETHLTIWCGISYTGNGFPVFSWTKSNTEKNIAANTITSGRGPITNTSLIMQQLHASDSGVTFQCKVTVQMPNNSKDVAHTGYEYQWNYTLYGPRNLSIVEYEDRLECSADGNPTPTYRWTDVETNISTDGPVYMLYRTNVNKHTVECTATNIFAAERKNYTIKGWTPGVSEFPITALAVGGSLLFLLITAIIVSFVVHRKRLKGSDGQTIADNAVCAEDMKPKGPSKGSQGGNIGDDSGPPQIPNQERKIVIGADGTVYAELSGVKAPARKGEVPKPPAFSQVEIYAAIDHSGKVPALPILPKL